MKINNISKDIITVEDFWSAEQCDSYIKMSEELGYGPALVQTRFGQRRIDRVRNNERILYDNPELANDIWKDLAGITPAQIGNSHAIGLNERFRFYKYGQNQIFRKHKDLSYIRNDQESSYYTFMIYLNDNFTGGTTTFDKFEITPKKGMCLIFLHSLLHEGTMVTSGFKYILRTDIMYRLK